MSPATSDDQWLKGILQAVPRRYRLSPSPDGSVYMDSFGMDTLNKETLDIDGVSASRRLAFVIEQARQAQADGQEPGQALKQVFITALARLIHEAMGLDPSKIADTVPIVDTSKTLKSSENNPTEKCRRMCGDPVFQALVLKYQSAPVGEYVSLSEHIRQDRRNVLAAVNAMAHPGKQQQMTPGWQRDMMVQLYDAATRAATAASGCDSRPGVQDVPTPVSSPFSTLASPVSSTPSALVSSTASASGATVCAQAPWSELADTVRSMVTMPQLAHEPLLERSLHRLLDHPGLERLQQFEALVQHHQVRQYQVLCDRQGPRTGSAMAVAQGATSQRRGAAVEALTARAFQRLAQRFNQQSRATYRVVTSMRVPASLVGGANHVKTEWDVVLLRQAATADSVSVWDVRLIAEAKASLDAATTDFPRLLRGLDLLAKADEKNVYSFQTDQSTVQVSGASLSALSADVARLENHVLYCCDAPSDVTAQSPVPLLNAANRMRLLSRPACLEFASALTQNQDANANANANANAERLEPVWHELLESPRLRPVLQHYPALRQVRELTVHPDDLQAVILE